LIEINNVSKTYKMGGQRVNALKEVTLSIKEGDYTAVTGPSGSGKSTLLFTIGGLLTPTVGDVIVNGSNVYQLKLHERAKFRRENIGFIFQTFELLPYLTALENVMLPLSIAGLSSYEQRERSLEALEKVGLGYRASHKPSELSGGEQQRVAVARGIVNDPNTLLADEPTGNLDQKTGDEIIRLLRELNEIDGQTILLVTHDEKKAKLSDRAISMVDGSIVNNGD